MMSIREIYIMIWLQMYFYETVISDNSREELNMQNSFIIHCKKNHLRNM